MDELSRNNLYHRVHRGTGRQNSNRYSALRHRPASSSLHGLLRRCSRARRVNGNRRLSWDLGGAVPDNGSAQAHRWYRLHPDRLLDGLGPCHKFMSMAYIR